MNDPIREILRKTDTAIGTPAPGENLADRVRRRARNQRRVRVMGAAVVAVVAVVLVKLPRNQPRPGVRAALPARNDLRWVEMDAKYHQMVADLLEKDERKVVPPDVSKADEFLWQLSQERNQAAFILVGSGDRNYEEFHNRLAAEANYRQVIHLFPDSPAAAMAQQRLRSIGGAKGRES
jgi:hypothetical protein